MRTVRSDFLELQKCIDEVQNDTIIRRELFVTDVNMCHEWHYAFSPDYTGDVKLPVVNKLFQ